MSISGIGGGGQGGYQFDLGAKIEKQGSEDAAQKSQSASGTPPPQATASAPGGASATVSSAAQDSTETSQSDRPRGATAPGVGGKLDISA